MAELIDIPIRAIPDHPVRFVRLVLRAIAKAQDWSIHHKPFTVNVDALMARIASV
jgi:hypothetical protein